VIPYAVKAGLGEYGRNQMVITEEFGPRVRFSKIFTNLPLNHDKPKKFGVREFCDICARCAEQCPPKALPFGPPEAGGENQSAARGVVKWTANCEKCFGYWAKLKTDCAICLRVCPYNKDFSKWWFRLGRKLAGTSLRHVILRLDTKLGYWRRSKPKDWWSKSAEDI
jgi:epoxyqueuosine reductase QueG